MSFSWVVVIAVYGIAEIDCVGRISDYCILLSETISCFEHGKHTDRTLNSCICIVSMLQRSVVKPQMALLKCIAMDSKSMWAGLHVKYKATWMNVACQKHG